MIGLDFSSAIARLRASMSTVPELSAAIQRGRLEEAAACFASIAGEQRQAYAVVREAVGPCA
jgi:hypothetical protein